MLDEHLQFDNQNILLHHCDNTTETCFVTRQSAQSFFCQQHHMIWKLSINAIQLRNLVAVTGYINDLKNLNRSRKKFFNCNFSRYFVLR